jgi:hypothetical protein
VRVVLTLLARDEADVVEWQLLYHYALGIDFVVATDHRSVDGTTEILRRFEAEGRLRYIRDDSERISQADQMTRMARIAATEHGADWVVPSDADEFWWPRRSSFHEILEAVPIEVGVVRGFIRTFVPRPEDGRLFHERMTILSRPIADHENIYQPNVHVVHRAHPAINVTRGFHDAYADDLGRLIRDWCPFEVLHFPNRTAAQIARKYAQGFHAWIGAERGGRHIQAAYRVLESAGLEQLWDERVVDGETLDTGLRDGAFTEDTRLRDILREIEQGRPASMLPPTRGEDARFYDELGTMKNQDAATSLLLQANNLEHRVSSLDMARTAPG